MLEEEKWTNQFLLTLIKSRPEEERWMKEKAQGKEKKYSITPGKMSLSYEEETLHIGYRVETTINVQSNHDETYGAHLKVVKKMS